MTAILQRSEAPSTAAYMSAIIDTSCLENQLLLCCARTEIPAQIARQIQQLSAQAIDWQYLLKLAADHEVKPLLFQALNTTCPNDVPTAVLDQLRQFFYGNTAHNLLKTKELLNLLSILKENNVAAIPFKGPVLAVKAYGKVAFRDFCDLDFLIRKQDIFKTKDLILAQGTYQLTSHTPLNTTHELMYSRAACEFSFVDYERHIAIEPHWEFTQKKHCISLDIESVWRRQQKIVLEGERVPTFSIEDSLLIVCINGAKDQWRKVKTICDVAELIRSHPDIDWFLLIEESQKVGCKRIVLLGILLANRVLGAAIPAPVSVHVKNDSRALDMLLNQVVQALFSDDRLPRKSVGANFSLWNLQVRERFVDKVRYCSNLVFGPNEGDVEFVSLPPAFAWMYLFIRPIRLVTRWAVSFL